MVCRVCGNELEDDLICPMCGENHQDRTEETIEEGSAPNKVVKQKKTIKIKISKKALVVFCGIVLVAVVIFISYCLVHYGLMGSFGQFPKGL